MTTPATVDRHTMVSRLKTVRDQVAPKATDEELLYFAEVCAKTGLSWFHNQIVLIPRWDSRLKREVHRAQITVEGRSAIAARTGELTGIDGPYWTGPRDKSGNLHWAELWTSEDEPPYAARVFVHRKNWVIPANGTVKWSEFAEKNKDGDLLALWVAMPSHMLGKTALSLALRHAFPEVAQAIADIESDDDYEWTPIDVPAGTVSDQPPSVPISEPAPVLPPAATKRGGKSTGRTPTPVDTPAPLTVEDVPRPPSSLQGAAHRVIGALETDAREAFLTMFQIEDFSDPWPSDAIDYALERPFEEPAEHLPL